MVDEQTARARVRHGGRVKPARDLAAEGQDHAAVRQTFVHHAFTRLPLVGAFVITINLFVQVRGDIGLAVAVAQNLTFGAVAVIVLLNLVVYIMLGVMVATMPLIFDPDYNRWTRVVGGALLILLTVVLVYTSSWLLIAALVVVFVVVGIIVRRSRRKPAAPLTTDTVEEVLRPSEPPLDTELRQLWADGRAMLRVVSTDPPALTPTEAGMVPGPEPKAFRPLADEWNSRTEAIREPRSKTITRLAFAGTIGFVALFGLSVVTQPIRFAPLEAVSIKGAEPEAGFVLLQGTRGMFVPNIFGDAQFITADDITSRELCEDRPRWWSVSVIQLIAPLPIAGVECSTPLR